MGIVKKTDLGKILQAWVSPMVARLVTSGSLKYEDVKAPITEYIRQEWLRQLRERKEEIKRKLRWGNKNMDELRVEWDRLIVEERKLSK